MTNWYAYRWVCSNCKAVHYYKIGICRRCGCRSIDRIVNNPELVEGLKTGKVNPGKTWGPTEVVRETEQGPCVPEVDRPTEDAEEELDELEIPEEPSAKPPTDTGELDDLINDILGD